MHEGQDVWWFATTAEIFGSLCGPSSNMPTSLPGNIYCPRWDKLVLTSTPTMALTTLFYHVTEIHVATKESNKVVLLSFRTNLAQQRKRIGDATVNYFNRGYMAGTQCQIETGHNINMTADEIATIQTGEVEATTGGNVFHQIATALSWQQGWMWTFNLPIQVQQVVDNQHVWAKAIYLCLEYSGTGIVNTLPAEAQRAINNILETNHPLQQGIQLQHYGSKTRERLRGNPAIMEWVNTTSNFQEFADAFNTYHGSNMDDANMEGDGDSANRD